MRKITFALLLLAVVVVACSKNEKPAAEVKEPAQAHPQEKLAPETVAPQLIKESTVGLAKIGMTTEELRQQYPQYTFQDKPVYEFGVDGEGKGLIAMQNDQPQFFVWTLDGENTVHGIVVLSEGFVTEDGLKVGTTIEQILEKYPEAEIQRDGIDPNMEYINIEDKKITLHFINPPDQTIGEYETDNPDETSRSFDLDRKVDRIYVN